MSGWMDRLGERLFCWLWGRIHQAMMDSDWPERMAEHDR